MPVGGRFDFRDHEFGARGTAQGRQEADRQVGAGYRASVLRSSCTNGCSELSAGGGAKAFGHSEFRAIAPIE